MSDKTEFTPWAEDEIEFLSGNWQIRRSHLEGFYDYTFGGVEASAPVDAYQLIEWGMAKVKTYDALLPWTAEITFSEDAEVMRDLTVTEGDLTDRTYVLRENGKYLRCNKYYLIQQGHAVPTEALVQKIEKGKVKPKKTEKIFWEEDKIIVTAKDGVVVEKGSRPGSYRVMKNGMTTTYDAARMVEAKLAVTFYDYKIESLEKHSALTWKKYGQELHDFWMNAHPEQIKTLRDVAMIWDGMQKNPDDVNLRRIIDYNRALVPSNSSSDAQISAIKAYTLSLTFSRVDYDLAAPKAKEAANKIVEQFTYVSVLSDFALFNTLRITFETEKSKLATWRGSVETIVRNEAAEYGSMTSGSSASTERTESASEPFPISCLPQEAITEQMRSDYNAALTKKSTPQTGLAEAHNEFKQKSGALLNLDIAFAELTDKVAAILIEVGKRAHRRAELDNFKTSQLDGYITIGKKPGLFCKPHKDDNIRFTSNAKIKKEKICGYRLYGRVSHIYVSYVDLIYLGLAERI